MIFAHSCCYWPGFGHTRPTFSLTKDFFSTHPDFGILFLVMASISQNSGPVDAVKAFIACVKTKDLEYMRRVIHPKATACLIRENEPRFQALTEAIDTLEKAEQELVEATWDEVEHIDGEYATVWTRFSMHRDGEASNPSARGRATYLADPSCSFIKSVRARIHAGKALVWAGSS
jgi:hypothetical protein